MHLVGFNIEIYYEARPYERQITLLNSLSGILHSRMTTDLKYSHIYIFNYFKTLYQMLELCKAEGDRLIEKHKVKSSLDHFSNIHI